MAVFFVTTGVSPNPGRPFCFHFDCACETIEDASNRLSKGEMLYGDKLSVTHDGRGGLLIRGREAMALGVAQVGILQNSSKRVWEPQD